MDRREFMSRATALGVSATAAYGMLGLPTPAQAGGHIQAGGTLRMQMEVRALKDPRTYLSLIHISEPTRLRRISYAVFCCEVVAVVPLNALANVQCVLRRVCVCAPAFK